MQAFLIVTRSMGSEALALRLALRVTMLAAQQNRETLEKEVNMSQHYVTSKLLLSALVTAFGMSATSCGDGVTGVDSSSDLAGRWVAVRVEFTVMADPRIRRD